MVFGRRAVAGSIDALLEPLTVAELRLILFLSKLP
jgi:hypothetical protein